MSVTQSNNNNNNNNNKKGKNMHTPCDSLTKKSNLCKNNGCFTLVVENFRYNVCGVHRDPELFRKGRKGVHVEPQLIEMTDQSSPKPVDRASVMAGIPGVRRASELLASINEDDNPVASAYLNKEGNTMPTITEIQGDHGQTSPDYEEFVADNQVQDFKLLCLSGHRPQKIGGFNPNVRYWVVFLALLAKVQDFVKANPNHQVVIGWGGALGVDQIGAEVAKLLGLPHIVFIPMKGFNAPWPDQSKDYFNSLAGESDEYWLNRVIEERTPVHVATKKGALYVSEPGYSASKLHKRNHVMVDTADAMLFLWDGSDGGTKACLNYAVEKEATRVIIHTRDLRIDADAKYLHKLTAGQ